MVQNKHKILKILKEYEIKPSYQRVQILEYLMEDMSHPTAERIYSNIHSKLPILSKATVYNTLNLFVEKNLISTLMIDKLELRYDIENKKHGHFLCKKCEKIYNFTYNKINKYEKLYNFFIEEEEILLKGICKRCKEVE